MNWYLQKSDKTIYGPVDLATLCGWAASGRIMPDDEVSSDKKTWQAAPALADLKMVWLIDLGEGERFGPVHQLALADLVRDGSAPVDQPVIHATDGTTCTLAEAVLPALLKQPAPLAPAPIPEPVAAPEPPPPPPAVEDPELPRLRSLLSEAEARLRELELARRAPAELQVANQTVDAATLLDTYRELSHNYDNLLDQLNGKAAELAQTLAAHAAIKKDLENQLAQAREAGQRYQRDAEIARQKMNEVEQTHLEVVRSYRDLNERYIRLRQQQADSASAPAPKTPEKPKVRLV